ncbi:MAG TPA: competence/damage-inducible protein A [Firmicutes bacterium]|nr:competence/damage-inducible protein A [Bacillota bacterium]
MKAELVIIGTELLLGETVDTNAAFLAQELAALGIDLYYKSTVGDNWVRIIEVMTQALARSDLVIASGGLGPTMDDLTREAISAVANLPLELDQEAMKMIEGYFQQTKRSMSENNRRQAFLPRGAKIIANHWGTAPGMIVNIQDKIIVALPGVPRELKGMFTTYVAPYLSQRITAKKTLVSRTLKFAGIGESQLAELVHDELLNQSNPTIAPYASLGEVKLRITAKADSSQQAYELIQPVEQRLIHQLNGYYYGADHETLESVVGAMLRERQETLAVAESCTGGLITNRITNVPGSSEYFDRGYITYSNQAKVELLGVDPSLIGQFGAVSREVAVAMAEGARARAGTDWSLAVTGIAGPAGGSKEKPVGLVHIAVSAKGNTKAKQFRFNGTRTEIKFLVAQAALNFLRQEIKDTE